MYVYAHTHTHICEYDSNTSINRPYAGMKIEHAESGYNEVLPLLLLLVLLVLTLRRDHRVYLRYTQHAVPENQFLEPET